MSHPHRWLLAATLAVTAGALVMTHPPARAGGKGEKGEKKELVDNPFYKFWANHKKGSVAVHLEKSKLGGQAGKFAPEGEEKRIAYKLLEVSDKRVVVEM